MTDYSAAAEWTSLGFLALVTMVLWVLQRKIAVAAADVTYKPADGVERHVDAGSVIPQAAIPLVLAKDYRERRVSALYGMLVGKDNRISTSKVVAFAWTYAIVFGIVALIVAKWLGSAQGYDTLITKGLQEEYLLFLGGPYAAAVLAKYKAVTDVQGASGKPQAPVGTARAQQLVADDRGDGDLGDLQYVLFNVVALGWFLGTFVPHLSNGMPDVPSLLAGLALTSAAGYSAKKLVSQAAPVLTGLQPAAAPASTTTAESTIHVFGRNLVLAAGGGGDGETKPPTVNIGGRAAAVTETSQPLGVDRVTVRVPSALPPGATKVTAMRADGTPATGPGGTDGLTLTVTEPPPS